MSGKEDSCRCAGINEDLNPNAQRLFLWAAPQGTLEGFPLLQAALLKQLIPENEEI